MSKAMLRGTVLGVAVATAGGAIAGYNMLNQTEEYADVVSVTPVTEQVRTPREECRDEIVTQQEQTRAEQTIQQVCKTVYDITEHNVGYDVRYRIGDDEPNQVRLAYDPGPRIPMRNGFLVLG